MTKFQEIKNMNEKQMIELLTSEGNCNHCNIQLYNFCRNTYARCGCKSIAKSFLNRKNVRYRNRRHPKISINYC